MPALPIGGRTPPPNSQQQPEPDIYRPASKRYKRRLLDYRYAESPAEEEARREREARKPFWKQRRAPAPLKEGKPVAFYVPINYDLAGQPEDWRWPTACYLNFIHWGNACWRADEFGYVRLKHQYLNRVIPDGMIRPIRKRLEADGVIDVDPELRPSRCFGHRLTDRYHQTSRVVCTDLKVNRRIWRVMRRDDLDLLPVHRHLKAKMDLVQFDLDRARLIIPLSPKTRRRRLTCPPICLSSCPRA
jgi:hypothetical protein